ncbi:hypothetical protein Syun_013160 [Stephania yunnanensis]|uniref:Uncharacterized protein n=1 Tax=Stephania yunnanensis TaxID=152371 RepID=A0AAP0K313_9MAGN
MSADYRPAQSRVATRCHSLALNMYAGNMSSSTDQKLDRLLSVMEHFFSSCKVQVNPDMDSSYLHNYGRYEDSHYYNVNVVGMPQNRYQNINMNSFVQQVEVCEICGDYSHRAHNCPYHPQYENYHYSSYAPPQPDFSGFISHPQVPQHEINQQFHQSLSLEDMMMQMIYQIRESAQDLRRASHIRQLDFSCPGSKDLVADLDQNSATLHRTIDEAELCSTQPTFSPEVDVSDNTLTNLEVNDVTQGGDYLIETSEECDVFQIEPEIVIALNEGEDEMEIDVNSDMSEKPHIESEEDQLLVLVQPPTLSCTYGTPYKGVEVRERLQIFYSADTFVLDDPDTIDSFVLEVPDELLNLKEGVHASLPNYVDAPFVVDFSKGEGIT